MVQSSDEEFKPYVKENIISEETASTVRGFWRIQ